MARTMKDRLALATLVLVALAVAAPLWGPGMVNTRGGGDSPFLLQRTHQLVANLRAGVFPARWMGDGAYGFGFPFYNYYSALPFYLAGVLEIAGLDLLTALKAVQTLGFLASAVAMYGWMRRLSWSRWAAWLSAVAYTVAPFHLVNVYVRGDSLSEFFAFAFYPLILWGLDKLLDGKWSRVQIGPYSLPFTAAWIWPALAYAGLIMTHNISAFIFTPFVLLYLLALLMRRPDRWRYVLTTGSVALGFGLLLSAWVWVPALAETDLVQAQTLTADYFHHSQHFRTTDLVQRGLLFNYSTAPGRDSPFAMGLAQALFALLGAVALAGGIYRRRTQTGTQRRGRGFILLGLLLSTLMITPLTRLLWDHLPLLPMTQFPWRFLSVQALFAAAAVAALVPQGRRALWVGLPAATILVASVLVPLNPDRLPIGPDDVTTERLQLYELFTQNIGTTIRYEWLPSDAVPRPFTSDALVQPGEPARAIALAGAELEARSVARRPTTQEWQVGGNGGAIAFPVFYWPGWTAQVDSVRTDVWPVEGSGYLAVEVPPGEHRVTLRLTRTPARIGGEVASLLAFIAVVVALIIARREIRWKLAARYVGIASLPVLMLLLIPTAVADHDAGLTMDFHQMPYLHHNPGGVSFAGGARLESYTLSAEELAPGDPLTVRLSWAAPSDVTTATVRLVSPAALRHEVEPFAEVSQQVSEGRADWALALPEDIARGVYLVEVSLFDQAGELRALTPGGRSRGPLYLLPVRVPQGPPLPREASVLAPFGPAIRLHASTIAQPRPDQLSVHLSWSSVHPLATNYGISLRIVNDAGDILSAFDTQPGYGFLPTSMWRPGEQVSDHYLLEIPDDLVPGGGYHLHVILYQVSSGEVVGQTRLGDFSLPLAVPFEANRPPRSFTLPPLQHPAAVEFDEEIRLAGYDIEQDGQAVDLTLHWQALQAPAGDYTVFVHLFDPATHEVVAQSDAMPQGGAYPTSWWSPREVISEVVSLPLAGLPRGEYQLAVGLYDQTMTRLRAIGPDGERVADDWVILAEAVEVR